MLSINNYLSEEEKEKVQYIKDSKKVKQIKRNKIAEIMFTTDDPSFTKNNKILNTDAYAFKNAHLITDLRPIGFDQLKKDTGLLVRKDVNKSKGKDVNKSKGKDIDYLYIIYKNTNIKCKSKLINVNKIRLSIINGEISQIYKGLYNEKKLNEKYIKRNFELIYDDKTLKFKYTNILDLKEVQTSFIVSTCIPYHVFIKLAGKNLKGSGYFSRQGRCEHYIDSIDDVDNFLYAYKDSISDVQWISINGSAVYSESICIIFDNFRNTINDNKLLFNNILNCLYKPETRYIHALQFKKTIFSFKAFYDYYSYKVEIDRDLQYFINKRTD